LNILIAFNKHQCLYPNYNFIPVLLIINEADLVWPEVQKNPGQSRNLSCCPESPNWP